MKNTAFLAIILLSITYSQAGTNEITPEQLVDAGWSRSAANSLLGQNICLMFLTSSGLATDRNYFSYYEYYINQWANAESSVFKGISSDWSLIASTPTTNSKNYLEQYQGFTTTEQITGYCAGGVKIFDDYSDLWSGTLLHPINIKETGFIPTVDNYQVWTGTSSDGMKSANPFSSSTVTYGLCQSTDSTWTDSSTRTYGAKQSFYAISQVLTVTGEKVPVTSYYGFDYPLLFDMYACPSKNDPSISPSTTRPYGYIDGHNEITPIYYTGAPWDPIATNFKNGMMEMGRQNRPVGIFLDPRSAPINGTLYPDALQTVMDYRHAAGGRLDFVFMDFEPTGSTSTNAEVSKVVELVRGYSDSNINQARMGNYAYSPGAYNGTGNFYLSSGLNVAMPQMYAYSYYTYLYGGSSYGDPNNRSALFNAPLELVSRGARGLPEGHLLIPFVAGFDDRDGGTVAPPPHEDTEALLQHIRLRGADGYYLYRSLDTSWYAPAVPDDTYGNENLRDHMLAAWHELDWLFDGVDKADVDVLNLATRTAAGLEWSGVVTSNGVAILVSYLGNGAGYWFDVPEISGYEGLLPDRIYVESGTHQMITVVPEPVSGVLFGFMASICILRKHYKYRAR